MERFYHHHHSPARTSPDSLRGWLPTAPPWDSCLMVGDFSQIRPGQKDEIPLSPSLVVSDNQTGEETGLGQGRDRRWWKQTTSMATWLPHQAWHLPAGLGQIHHAWQHSLCLPLHLLLLLQIRSPQLAPASLYTLPLFFQTFSFPHPHPCLSAFSPFPFSLLQVFVAINHA